MRLPERVARDLAGWRGDAVLATALIAVLLAFDRGMYSSWGGLLEIGSGVGLSATIVARRGHPTLAALAAAGCLALASLGPSLGLPSALQLVAVILLAYSLGTTARPGWSALTLLVLGTGLQAVNGITVFNPFLVVLLVGPWAIGLAAGSRRRLTEQLAARGRELETERELFAAEAVRYERARIARELHDVVAHCISVMVIQASAGQRLSATDPEQAAEAFDAIAEVVRQAESEIGRLVELLDHEPPAHGADGILLVDELVARAGAAGLAVSCRITGSTGRLPEHASDTAYRVVQESLTNALKHSPGAPVEVVIAGSGDHMDIAVVNGTTPVPASAAVPAAVPAPAAFPMVGLQRAGGGYGLAGMRERVAACGGEMSAGPTEGGGWQVRARLPCGPGRVPAC